MTRFATENAGHLLSHFSSVVRQSPLRLIYSSFLWFAVITVALPVLPCSVKHLVGLTKLYRKLRQMTVIPRSHHQFAKCCRILHALSSQDSRMRIGVLPTVLDVIWVAAEYQISRVQQKLPVCKFALI